MSKQPCLCLLTLSTTPSRASWGLLFRRLAVWIVSSRKKNGKIRIFCSWVAVSMDHTADWLPWPDAWLPPPRWISMSPAPTKASQAWPQCNAPPPLLRSGLNRRPRLKGSNPQPGDGTLKTRYSTRMLVWLLWIWMDGWMMDGHEVKLSLRRVWVEEKLWLTVAVTLSQSDTKALNPSPNTAPAVLKTSGILRLLYTNCTLHTC